MAKTLTSQYEDDAKYRREQYRRRVNGYLSPSMIHYFQEQKWKLRGEEAIDAEQERLLKEWLWRKGIR